MLPFRFLVALTIALASPAHAGEAQGKMTLDGTTVSLNVANALELPGHDGKPFTVVLLTEAPIDLSAALASSDPYVALLNDGRLDAVTHAMVLVGDERVSINAHKVGNKEQYLATRKFGLEAKISGGGTKPLEGSLRSTTAEMSVQIDATFKTNVLKPKT
jgi:hypothetical protein